MKHFFIVETISNKNGCSLFDEQFPIAPGNQCNLNTIVLAKTYFQVNGSVGMVFLREMDQKFEFGGTIGYADSYLEFVFRLSKVYRLQAKLHDAAGVVKAHSGKGPGCCSIIGRGPNSCLLSRVTGLLFCLYKKVFLPFFFKYVDFWSSMSCLVLDIEQTDTIVVKELRFLW